MALLVMYQVRGRIGQLLRTTRGTVEAVFVWYNYYYSYYGKTVLLTYCVKTDR